MRASVHGGYHWAGILEDAWCHHAWTHDTCSPLHGHQCTWISSTHTTHWEGAEGDVLSPRGRALISRNQVADAGPDMMS